MAPPIRTGSSWQVTVTQLGRVSSALAVSSSGIESQLILEPCGITTCRPGATFASIDCRRPGPSAAWQCGAIELYPSNGSTLFVTRMVTTQFLYSLDDVAHSRSLGQYPLGLDPVFHRFSRLLAPLGRVTCMSASQLAPSGALHQRITWCLTPAGVPAALYGVHDSPGWVQALRLTSLSQAEPALLQPFATPAQVQTYPPY